MSGGRLLLVAYRHAQPMLGTVYSFRPAKLEKHRQTPDVHPFSDFEALTVVRAKPSTRPNAAQCRGPGTG
jgi:hypothetical protein